MTSIKIEGFAGISPRYSNRLQPNNGAVRADNCKLLSGELRGLRETQLLKEFSSTTKRAYRLPATVAAPLPISGSDFWVGFAGTEVDFVRTPVLNDSFERYYWTGDEMSAPFGAAPTYSTRALIQAAGTPFKLGIPAPVTAPTVTGPGGVTEVRSYVYTFVSAYGEEGPPSPPGTDTSDPGTWGLSGIDAVPPGTPTDYNITTVRIYRTVVGTTATEYFFVADISLGTTTYTDTQTSAVVALNYTMQTLTWDPPPDTLRGIISHPGGFLVGFSGRDLYMSVPYQPHAWPVQNIQTCSTEIVGIAVYNNVIIITTTSHLYYAEGMNPEAVTLQKLESIDPCISRRSVATTIDGVYYSSPQGIIRATGGKTDLISRQLFTREEWQNYFSPTTVQAVPYGVQYIAFDTADAGFIFSPSEEAAPLTTLDRFSNVDAIQIDAYSGDVYIMQGNQARLWDPPESTPYTYTWKSKEFDLPKPVSFGALRLKFVAGGTTIPDDLLADYIDYNEQRILKPLDCLNLYAIGGVRTETITGQGSIIVQNKQPIGGSPLYNIARLNNVQNAVQVNVYARNKNSTWVQVFSWTVTSERIHRLPAGFKSDGWQIELIGNTNVYSVAMAETGKELENV